MRDYSLSDFDYRLPSELIAQHPAAQRSASRLLDGSGDQPADRVFRDLPQRLQPGDLLVFNDTGAYGASMSSNYNSRPLIPEVLVDGGRARLIRRRQTVRELLALEA